MKFDYDNNDLDIGHQISRHEKDGLDPKIKDSRESFKFKRIHNKTIMFGVLLLEILVILLVASYYVSPLSHISNVSVSGNHTIMSQSIIYDMKSKPGDSIIRLLNHHTRYERSAFKKNAQLKAIHVGVHNWNHVRITVKEYPIIAYLHHDQHYFAVSNNGKRAYQNTKPNQVDPVLFDFKTKSVLNAFVKSYQQIPDSIKPDINKVYYSPTQIDPNRIKICMNDGNLVYADFKTWNHKIKYYPAISKSMKKRGIINLELGVYSRPFKKANRVH